MLFKIYLTSVVVSIMVAWIAASNLSDKLEQAGMEPTEGSAKSAGRGAGSYLLLFVPIVNLMIAGCFAFCHQKIYQELKNERENQS